MGCGDSRVVPPSLPRKPIDEALLESAGFVSAVRKRAPLKDPFEKEILDGEDEDDPDDCEFDFVTEKSKPDMVAKVVRDFVPVENDDDLVIVGVACSRLISAVQRTKLEEERILENLRNEGLIARPLKRSPNATGFEIVEENAERKQRFVPQTIRDREQRPASRTLTNEAIAQKLARAEERRKQQEEEKKARAMTARPLRTSLQTRREEEQEELRNQQQEKWEQGLRNRELLLMDVQEKLKEKHQEKHQRIKGLHFKKSNKGVDPFDDD